MAKGVHSQRRQLKKRGRAIGRRCRSLISPCPYMLTEDPEAEEYEL